MLSMGYTKKLHTEGFGDIYPFLTPPSPHRFFLICQLTLRKQDFTTVNSTKLFHTPSEFQPNFLAKFPDSPWLFGIQVP